MDIIAHCRAAVKEPGSASFIKKRAVFCQAPPRSDKQALCQSDTIAAPALCGQHPCPLSHRFAMPQPGLRHPASATLSLASCWPLPQQLLPVSAAGGGRRRCPQRGSLGRSAPVLCTNTPKTLSERGALRAKRKKIAFPLAKRGKTRYSIVTV